MFLYVYVAYLINATAKSWLAPGCSWQPALLQKQFVVSGGN
jgi:hypothetical protein